MARRPKRFASRSPMEHCTPSTSPRTTRACRRCSRFRTSWAQATIYKNVIVGGGPAPVRAYITELLPDVLEGRIEPGRVLHRTVGLDGVPDGYRAMQSRESIKVMVAP